MGKTEGTTSVFVRDRWDEIRKRVADLGFVSYEVGGSVRDEISGRAPHDLDIAVEGASFEELRSRLEREGKVEPLTVHGQMIGMRLWAPWTPKEGIEFALARKESSTGPKHTDFQIDTDTSFTIHDDLARRDFTVNAIAREIRPDGTGKIIDPFNGTDDIRTGTLRMISENTIAEDPLRVMRGLVRVAKDGFDIEPETGQAMARQSVNLRPDGPLTAERIFEETDSLVQGPHAGKAFRYARDLGIFENVFPELAPMVGFDQQSKYHSMTVDEHCFRALERAEQLGASREVRWAALLHDAGKPETAFLGSDGRLHYYKNPDDPDSVTHEEKGEEIAGNLLRRLKAPNDLQRDVKLLVREHMFGEASDMDKRSETRNRIKARRFIQRVGRNRVHDLMMLRRCDTSGKVEGDLDERFFDRFNRFEALVQEELSSPVERKDLAVTGHDLIGIGLKGPAIGQVMGELLEWVVVQPEANNPEKLISRASKLKRKIPA